MDAYLHLVFDFSHEYPLWRYYAVTKDIQVRNRSFHKLRLFVIPRGIAKSWLFYFTENVGFGLKRGLYFKEDMDEKEEFIESCNCNVCGMYVWYAGL